MRVPAIALAIALAGASQAPAPTLDGVGPVRFVMSVADASRVLNRPSLATDLENEDCTYFEAPIGRRTWSFMVEGGIVVRLDVHDSLVHTPRGARVGLTDDSVQALYGHRLRVRPHEYTNGHYLVYVAQRDTLRRLVFETDGHRVTEWRMGLFPQVEYVEGCG
jgi:hypothetical protein